MADRRYITISVAYEPATMAGRSLDWIAPELGSAGLTLIEDYREPSPSRTGTGRGQGGAGAREVCQLTAIDQLDALETFRRRGPGS